MYTITRRCDIFSKLAESAFFCGSRNDFFHLWQNIFHALFSHLVWSQVLSSSDEGWKSEAIEIRPRVTLGSWCPVPPGPPVSVPLVGVFTTPGNHQGPFFPLLLQQKVLGWLMKNWGFVEDPCWFYAFRGIFEKDSDPIPIPFPFF